MKFFLLIIMTLSSLSSYASKWVYISDVDELTQKVTQGFFILANNNKKYSEKDNGLYLICKDNEYFFTLFTGFLTLSEKTVKVQYRFDNDPIINDHWSINKTNNALYVYKNKLFLERLLISNRLVIRVSPRHTKDKTLVLNTAGLSDEINDKTQRTTCWQ